MFIVGVQAAYPQPFSPDIKGIAIVEIWTTATGESHQVGSGVAIDLDGDILTAKHVLKGFNGANQSIYVRFNARSGNPIRVQSYKCAAGDPDKDGADICVLKVGDIDLKNTAQIVSVQPMMCRKLVSDEKITGSGWPGDSKFSWESIDGHITQSATVLGYPTSSRALPGMSGGPFYDEKGEIVGLIKGGVENDARTLLAPLFSARALIDDTGTPCPVPNEVDLRPPHEVSREITWGIQVGGSGGDPFKISCGAGEALAGLYGKAGGSGDVRVFSVGPLCVSAVLPLSQTEWKGTPYSGDYIGADQGDNFDIRCPAQMGRTRFEPPVDWFF
jgi:V8-like Glu-specific endopeptidase